MMTKRKTVIRIIFLSILLLCCCITAFCRLVLPLKQERMPQAPDEETFGMLLIDIPDQETAGFYHVEQLGVYVLAVDEESPAFEAGVHSGDCVIAIDGARISSIAEFTKAVAASSGARTVEMTFSRGAEEKIFTVCFDTDG